MKGCFWEDNCLEKIALLIQEINFSDTLFADITFDGQPKKQRFNQDAPRYPLMDDLFAFFTYRLPREFFFGAVLCREIVGWGIPMFHIPQKIQVLD